jgi:hypothetical protein
LRYSQWRWVTAARCRQRQPESVRSASCKKKAVKARRVKGRRRASKRCSSRLGVACSGVWVGLGGAAAGAPALVAAAVLCLWRRARRRKMMAWKMIWRGARSVKMGRRVRDVQMRLQHGAAPHHAGPGWQHQRPLVVLRLGRDALFGGD